MTQVPIWTLWLIPSGTLLAGAVTALAAYLGVRYTSKAAATREAQQWTRETRREDARLQREQLARHSDKLAAATLEYAELVYQYSWRSPIVKTGSVREGLIAEVHRKGNEVLFYAQSAATRKALVSSMGAADAYLDTAAAATAEDWMAMADVDAHSENTLVIASRAVTEELAKLTGFVRQELGLVDELSEVAPIPSE